MSSETSLTPLVIRLRALGLHGLVAAFMEEGGGPLTQLSAQLLYGLAPTLRLFTEDDMPNILAAVLEDPTASRAFAQQLVQGDPS